MGTFDQLVDKLDADNGVKGHQFERIAKWFLINDPSAPVSKGPSRSHRQHSVGEFAACARAGLLGR